MLHTLNSQWSLRAALDSDDDPKFYFASMAVDPNGYIVLGPKPTWSGATCYATGSVGMLPSILHVWAGDDFWGSELTSQGYATVSNTYDRSGGDHPGTRWESNWIDFDDNTRQNRVFHVEAEIVSYGNMDLELLWAQDYDYAFTSAGYQAMNRSETYLTTSEDPVMGPTNNSVARNYFAPGTAVQDGRVVRLRWDVSTKLVQNFKFRLQPRTAGTPWHLVTFHVYYDSQDHKALNQKVRSNRGQPI